MYQCFNPECVKIVQKGVYKKLIRGSWHFACSATCAAVVDRITKEGN